MLSLYETHSFFYLALIRFPGNPDVFTSAPEHYNIEIYVEEG